MESDLVAADEVGSLPRDVERREIRLKRAEITEGARVATGEVVAGESVVSPYDFSRFLSCDFNRIVRNFK